MSDLKGCFRIKLPMKVYMPFNKETEESEIEFFDKLERFENEILISKTFFRETSLKFEYIYVFQMNN